ISLMLALAVLTVFSLISVQLFSLTMKTWAAAPLAQDKLMRGDNMLIQLREDVWLAREINVVNAGALDLTLADGSKAGWSAAPGGSIKRTAGEMLVWNKLGFDPAFKRHEGGLLLNGPGRPDDPPVVLLNMPSILKATAGRRP